MRKSSLLFLGALAGAGAVFLSVPGRFAIEARAAETPAAQSASDTYKQLALFGLIFDQVRAHYVDEPDVQKMVEGAVSGMLNGLDPHSSYMNSKSFGDMQVETNGEFGGLGMEVTMEDGLVKVVSPIDDTPAAKAGILANDVISELDGNPVKGLTLQQAVEKMRGPVNTSVRLKVLRKGQDKPLEFTLTRETIRVRSVRWRKEGDDVGYIRITQFNAQVGDELKKAIRALTAEPDKMKGYILDLRNNPGGLLDQAVTVSNAFLDRGEIVSLRGRNADDAQRFDAKSYPGDLIKGKPLIVLINGGSASASEIVAGALQDQKRATILGTRSFGKGSVQTIIPLGGNKGALRLTTARYYTPSGKSIQAKGVSPDIEVLQDVPADKQGLADMTSESKLRGHLKGQGEGAEQTGSQSYVPQDPKDDKALHTALDLLRGVKTANPAESKPEVKAPN